jgi:hypothetical protein
MAMERVFSYSFALITLSLFFNAALAKDDIVGVKYSPDSTKESVATPKTDPGHGDSLTSIGSCFVFMKSGHDYIKVKLPNNHPSCNKR